MADKSLIKLESLIIMKVNAFIQARMSSSRLPGKVLTNIVDKPMLQHIVERLRNAKMINEVVVLTSNEHSDDAISTFCDSHHIACFRGSLNDVLNRFYMASQIYPADHIVRITADCPLVDSELVDDIVAKHLAAKADFTSNCHPAMYPDGLDVEVMKASALHSAQSQADTAHQREHVTPFLFTHQEQFLCVNYDAPTELPLLRLTVDHPEDLTLIKKIYSVLYPLDTNFNLQKTLNLLAENPTWLDDNKQFSRNEATEV